MFADMPRKLKWPADVSVCAKISPHCTYVSGTKQAIQGFIQTAKEKGFNVEEVGSVAVDTIGILRGSGDIAKLTGELEKV